MSVEWCARQTGCSPRNLTPDDHWSHLSIPEEKLRPLLEAIGNAIVERLRPRGLLALVVDASPMLMIFCDVLNKESACDAERHKGSWPDAS